MSQYKFACPHCHQHLQCEEEFAGREIQCPACNLLMHIPPVPGKTVQFKPEAGKTWATFVPSGHVPPPKGLFLRPKQAAPKPAAES